MNLLCWLYIVTNHPYYNHCCNDKQGDSTRYDVAGTLEIARNTVSKLLTECRETISVSDIPIS